MQICRKPLIGGETTIYKYTSNRNEPGMLPAAFVHRGMASSGEGGGCRQGGGGGCGGGAGVASESPERDPEARVFLRSTSTRHVSFTKYSDMICSKENIPALFETCKLFCFWLLLWISSIG
jgi:hypothetical protein